jgi:hypothetical protein
LFSETLCPRHGGRGSRSRGLRQQGLALQPLPLGALEQLDLVLLVPAGHQHQVLLGDRLRHLAQLGVAVEDGSLPSARREGLSQAREAGLT